MISIFGNYLNFFCICLFFGLFVNKDFLEYVYKLRRKKISERYYKFYFYFGMDFIIVMDLW